MQRHIIHKQKVKLHVQNKKQSHMLQDSVSRMFGNGLSEGIERLLDKAAKPDEVIRIDKLIINLTAISVQNFEKEFKAKFLAEFDKKLSAVITEVKREGNKGAYYTQAQSLYSSLLYFLQHGILPWYSASKTMQEWEQEISSSFAQREWQQLFIALKQYHAVQPQVLERFVMQFSNGLLQSLLLTGIPQLHVNPDDIYADLLHFLDGQPRMVRDVIWLRIYQQAVIFEDNISMDLELTGAIKLLIKNPPQPDKGAAQSNKKTGKNTEDVLYVQNSGVVLLHPFLQMYFREIGLLNDTNVFLDDAAQQRAVLLINYLATGASEAAEFDLALQKLLCGLQFDDTVRAFIELTKQEEEEAGNLLVAVTRHWQPLNNTSVEGLRGTFLQREGRLSQTIAGWQLHIEYKTVDILLGKLPWGFSIIKLPWMDSMLNVGWH